MKLTPDECERLAVALADVQQHFPNLPIVPDKYVALATLAGCVGNIYGPRIAEIVGIRAPVPLEPAEPTPGDPVTVNPSLNGGGVPFEQSWFPPQ